MGKQLLKQIRVQLRGKRRRLITIVVAVVLATGVITAVVVTIHRQRVEPLRTTVLEVDDSTVSMGYFIKRTAMSDREPMTVLQDLAQEEIIKQVAPKAPYNIDVSDVDVDRFLRQMASSGSGEIDERDYQRWYRNRLNETQLTDAEFRDLARTDVLTQRLLQHLTGDISLQEQVLLEGIAVGDQETATEVRERLEAGEEFNTLVMEYDGGSLGWFPRSVLPERLENLVFDELEVGEVGGPAAIPNIQGSVVFKVSERSENRQLDQDSIRAIGARALDEWLNAELQHHDVRYRGFDGGYDSATNSWVQARVRELRRQDGS